MSNDHEEPEIEERARRIVAIIHNHPSISTEVLKKKLYQAAFIHDADDLERKDNPTLCEVDVCILISILKELVSYRNKYGLLTLPFEDWPFEQ